MEEGNQSPPPFDSMTPNLGKLIAEAEREKISTDDLQEAYNQIKQLIADRTDFRVVYGTIDGNAGRIKLTLEQR